MSGMFLAADGCRLHYETAGSGRPIFWQHGLGADAGQPAEVFPRLEGWQRITLECRGHGQSDLGPVAHLSIDQFAADVNELAVHLGISSYVIGGISLGAVIALRLACLQPQNVQAVVLARPAWVDEPAPVTMRPYLEVADLLARYGAIEGAEQFSRSQVLSEVEKVSPDNAQSLRWFFARPRADSTIDLLSRIPLDGPGLEEEDLRSIGCPTLVIGNEQDFVHPIATARRLADLIPTADFRQITAKSLSRAAYVSDFRDAMTVFLTARLGQTSP